MSASRKYNYRNNSSGIFKMSDEWTFKAKYNLIILSLFSILSCQQDTEPITYQFELFKKENTGLTHENNVTQSEELNVFNYMYFFNGGGVSAGDFNGDGLVDLFFTRNMQPNKLYLNEGNLKFKDVTKQAGLEGQEGWTTGCSVVDINNDGLLDIYVCQIGDYKSIKGKNQLYVCTGAGADGVPIFEDKAAEYGLDISAFSTQASFFDYDVDGDLDMFLLNHTLHQNGTFGKRNSFKDGHELAGDRLFRNDSQRGNIRYTDVTNKAGIRSTVIGYGLGIVTGDINLDGYPDIYIGNDFHENDYLYINQKDGTFSEELTEQMMHTSRFSMGVDMADINNDGWAEVLSLDMLPYDPYILKTSLGEDGFDVFKFKIGHGYNHQYARNALQLNNKNGTFSEIGIAAGVFATDWSWAALFSDFNHDGYKDIFISNGIPRRMNNIDYVNFQLSDADIKFKTENNHLTKDELDIVERMPQIKLPNKFFQNNKNLTFTDIEKNIKNDRPSYSNGAAYADLDNDGDLEIIVNNIDNEPFLYNNLTIENKEADQNYLYFQLKGSPKNINAIGTKIIIQKENEQIVYEHYPVRGYQSSVGMDVHIGVGDTSDVQSATVIWHDGTFEEISDLKYNQKSEISWSEVLPKFDFKTLHKKTNSTYDFTDVTQQSGLNFEHKENPFVEFNREGLMPHMVSSEGPALAVGDVNGDGLEDVFVGGAKRKRSALFLQEKSGKFVNKTPETIIVDSLFEDVDAVFVDIENDGDLDLVIASGGNEYRGEAEARKQRAYLNDGLGNFTRADIFNAHLTASCVLPADFNGDGLVDFFFGGRAVPYKYGENPNSYLYVNRGDTKFEVITLKFAKDLAETGMVKDGAWYDIDGDNDLDLILATEWQPIQIYLNQGLHFEKKEINNLSGWWNFVLPYDFDGDGDVDILAGNLGENSKLKVTENEPIRMYIEDYDDNGQAEQILTYYLNGKETVFANHAELTKQIVSLKKKYLYAKDFAKASMTDLFGKKKLSEAQVLEANFLKSAYFENTGNNLTFKTHSLPQELQFSTLETACLMPSSDKNKSEVLVGGNFYDCNIEMGRYDANFGNVLTIEKDGKMTVSSLGDLTIKGQTRRIKEIKINGKPHYIFAKNDDKLQVIRADYRK